MRETSPGGGPGRALPHRLIGLAAVSLVLRLALIPTLVGRPLVSDYATYVADAIQIGQGKAILDSANFAERAPVFPLLLAGVFFFAGPSLALVYAIQALVWTAVGLLTWRWGRPALGEGGALASAALVLFHPDGLVASGIPGVECLAALWFVLLALRFTALAERPVSPSRGLLDGLLAGVAILTVTTLGLFVAGGIAAASILRARRGLPLLAWLGPMALGAALPVSVWTVRNAYVLESFVPLTTVGGTALLGGNNPEADGEWNQAFVVRRKAEASPVSPVQWSRIARREAMEFAAGSPRLWLRLEALKLGKFFSPKPGSATRGRLGHPLVELLAPPLFWMPMLVLLPFGVSAARRGRPGLRFAVLGVGALLGVTLIFFALVRYRIPYIPAFALIASAGAERLTTPGPERRTRIRRAALWGALLLAVWTGLALERISKVREWLGASPVPPVTLKTLDFERSLFYRGES